MIGSYQNDLKVLCSKIAKQDPCREFKLFQVQSWYRAHLSLQKRGYDDSCLDFLAQVLSDECCWKEVDDLHKVKLDERVVAMEMIENLSSFPIASEQRFRLACWYCLEEHIYGLLGAYRKWKLGVEGGSTDQLGSDEDFLVEFWLNFTSCNISNSKLDLFEEYERGLRCALAMNQVAAMEFFSGRIHLLCEDKLSAKWKDDLFLEIAVLATEENYHPKIFEFCFGQISSDRYQELLEKDFCKNSRYGSFHALLNAFSFDRCRELFGYLKPDNVSENDYLRWLPVAVKEGPEVYKSAGKKLFTSMWEAEAFGVHRTSVNDWIDTKLQHSNSSQVKLGIIGASSSWF